MGYKLGANKTMEKMVETIVENPKYNIIGGYVRAVMDDIENNTCTIGIMPFEKYRHLLDDKPLHIENVLGDGLIFITGSYENLHQHGFDYAHQTAHKECIVVSGDDCIGLAFAPPDPNDNWHPYVWGYVHCDEQK